MKCGSLLLECLNDVPIDSLFTDLSNAFLTVTQRLLSVRTALNLLSSATHPDRNSNRRHLTLNALLRAPGTSPRRLLVPPPRLDGVLRVDRLCSVHLQRVAHLRLRLQSHVNLLLRFLNLRRVPPLVTPWQRSIGLFGVVREDFLALRGLHDLLAVRFAPPQL